MNEDYKLSDMKIKDAMKNESLKTNDVIIAANGKTTNLEFKKQLLERRKSLYGY